MRREARSLSMLDALQVYRSGRAVRTEDARQVDVVDRTRAEHVVRGDG